MTPEQETALRRIVTAHYGVLVSGHLADQVVAAARVLVLTAVAAERARCVALAECYLPAAVLAELEGIE